MTDAFFQPATILFMLPTAEVFARVQVLLGRAEFAHPTLTLPTGGPIFALHQDRASEPDSRRPALIIGDAPTMALGYAGTPEDPDFIPPADGPWHLTAYWHPDFLTSLRDPAPEDAHLTEGIVVSFTEVTPHE